MAVRSEHRHMKAVEFDGTLSGSGQIQVPPDVARELPAGSRVRVILLWQGDQDEAWNRKTRERFVAAYAPVDSIYDELIDDPPTR